MTRTDYDEFSAEADETSGPQVRVAGQDWTLPGRHQVSAKAVADFQRLRAVMASAMRDGALSDDDEVPDDLVEGMGKLTPAALLRLLIGEQADEMLDAGASHEAIERLSRDYSQYVEQGSGPLAPDLPPVNRKERRAKGKGQGSNGATSKSDGSSSKQTSAESTDST